MATRKDAAGKHVQDAGQQTRSPTVQDPGQERRARGTVYEPGYVYLHNRAHFNTFKDVLFYEAKSPVYNSSAAHTHAPAQTRRSKAATTSSKKPAAKPSGGPASQSIAYFPDDHPTEADLAYYRAGVDGPVLRTPSVQAGTPAGRIRVNPVVARAPLI